MREGKVFIDANMIINASKFRKSDVFSWINQLYEEIYVHIEVIAEVLEPIQQASLQEQILKNNWNKFDPSLLSVSELGLYELEVGRIANAFEVDTERRMAINPTYKSKSNMGEIHSLAAAMMIGANIINSNDFSIKKVIQEEDLRIQVGSDINAPMELIEQDTLEDFCVYCVQLGIGSGSNVRSFIRSVYEKEHTNRIESFNNRLELIKS